MIRIGFALGDMGCNLNFHAPLQLAKHIVINIFLVKDNILGPILRCDVAVKIILFDLK